MCVEEPGDEGISRTGRIGHWLGTGAGSQYFHAIIGEAAGSPERDNREPGPSPQQPGWWN